MFRRSISALCLLSISALTISTAPAQDVGAQYFATDYVTGFNSTESALSPDIPSVQFGNPVEPVEHSIGQYRTMGTRSPWFVRLGVGAISFADSGVFQANDSVIPGLGVAISDEATFVFDIGYQLSPKWSVTFSGGVPPKLDLDATGPFAGLQFGTTRFAPVVLALQRHFFLTDRTSIYVGGGVNYTWQYESIDGFVQNLDIENGWSGVVQLGVERRINNRASLYADAKKAFYDTRAFANSGGATLVGDIKAYTTVLSFGIRFDF